ncbi:hypothetical protein K7X08_001594 [Anisodus acutangulus]|uniref:NOSIC domain-containing protein n=1 Tax=Anisodus acutangulus TaxID=402998 RepID=A0A9Q1RGQ6_9SOLA|nr:hypothetical protein K7X08_001594 [Anisodus acutangulus]
MGVAAGNPTRKLWPKIVPTRRLWPECFANSREKEKRTCSNRSKEEDASKEAEALKLHGSSFDADALHTFIFLCCLKCLLATLADSFLADLDELSDNEAAVVDEENLDADQMEEDGDLADIEALNYDDLANVSKLQKSRRYIDIMQKVEDALEKESDITNKGVVLEDDPEYQLIVDCNALSVDIENEIVIIHNFIRDKYRLKFPELESLVHHPIDYARVVKKIGNEMDLTLC